jgi:hypothetical protein
MKYTSLAEPASASIELAANFINLCNAQAPAPQIYRRIDSGANHDHATSENSCWRRKGPERSGNTLRKLVYILILLLTGLNSYAKKYYVSPTGNDSNPGTITNPWKTWGKAFNAAGVNPGDTIYFRGGVYMKNIAEGQDTWYYPARSSNGTGYKVGNDGTIGNTIKYWAYPGEKPILDCGNTKAPAGSNYGIRSGSATYCHFRGLTVRNVWAHNIDNRPVECFAWQLGGTGYLVENCTAYNVHGIGFRIECSWNANFLNCDAYNCCDSVNPIGTPGERGTGFGMNNIQYNTTRVTFTNCRAWLCSDQGYSGLDNGLVEYRGCWAFRNGMLGAGGHGFKIGQYRHYCSTSGEWFAS